MIGKNPIPPNHHYVEFRFQDSLRNYEPVARKRVKLSHDHCMHCKRKHSDFSQQNRISRLRETRKRFNLQSRQQASGYTKRKQARSNSASKSIGIVSDFLCGNDHLVQPGQSKYIIEFSLSSKKEIKLVNPENTNQFPMETPYKQIIQAEINEREIEAQKQAMMSNEKKLNIIKDIDFHIGLVSQLHQQIFQSEQNREQIEEADLNKSESVKQFDICDHVMQDNLKISKNQQQLKDCGQFIKQSIQDGQMEIEDRIYIESNSKMEQQFNQLQQIRNSENQEQSECIDQEQKQSKVKMSQISHRNKRLKQFILNEKMSSQENSDIITEQGRIKFKFNERECYLSARVLYKLCITSGTTREEVTVKLLKRHPYLQNSERLNQQIINKIGQSKNKIQQLRIKTTIQDSQNKDSKRKNQPLLQESQN